MKNVDQEVSCPSCGWHPDGKEHWKCHCGHTWDVFSTGGRCPACLYHWEKTQCAPKAGGCNSVSPHMDWYGNLDGWLDKELTFLTVPEEKERRGSRGL
ncbi:hypothetical protein [Lewinella cohaerens]|uniref:hypothetical protein n=1 Tax=Lewinella cohaerens TaxID=70995 RepID=UPI0003A44499|nr:hypothetical protein [Lewinella cohaerens]